MQNLNLLFHLGEWSHYDAICFWLDLQNKGLGETQSFYSILDSLLIIMLITMVASINSSIHIYFISYDVIVAWKVCL